MGLAFGDLYFQHKLHYLSIKKYFLKEINVLGESCTFSPKGQKVRAHLNLWRDKTAGWGIRLRKYKNSLVGLSIQYWSDQITYQNYQVFLETGLGIDSSAPARRPEPVIRKAAGEGGVRPEQTGKMTRKNSHIL